MLQSSSPTLPYCTTESTLGRKRHIVVDVLGLVLGCYVTAAKKADVKAAPAVLVWVLDMYERIAKLLADKGYRGALVTLVGQAFEHRKVEVEISQRLVGVKGFHVEPKRWIVERTWTWARKCSHPDS